MVLLSNSVRSLCHIKTLLIKRVLAKKMRKHYALEEVTNERMDTPIDAAS